MEAEQENTIYVDLHNKMDNVNANIKLLNALLKRMEQEMRSKQYIDQNNKNTIFR
jgi:hypothetical protein